MWAVFECRVERRVERRVECRVECCAYFTVVVHVRVKNAKVESSLIKNVFRRKKIIFDAS